MTIDEKTETTPRGQIIGGIVMAVGMLAIVGALGSSFSRPASTSVHGAVLFLASLCVIIGLITFAASTVIAFIARAVERGRVEAAAAVAALATDNALAVAQLATEVQANNLVLRQLSAAPTVRLEEVKREMRQALERISREGIREIAEHIDKAVERGVQEGSVLAAREVASQGHSKAVEQRLGAIEGLLADAKQAVAEAYVDSLGDHPPSLRSVPPPRER